MNNNNLLSEKELYYLTISSIIGVGFFKLSHDVVKIVGQDGWLPNILGMVYPSYIIMISSYIIKRFPNDNIIDIGKKYFGKVLGTIFGFLYILEFIMVLSSVVSGFTGVLRVYAVTFLPRINIIMGIILAAWYCSMIGIKNIARMSKLTVYIFLIPITISIGALKSGSMLNLQPVLQSSAKDIMKATLLTIFQYSGMEFLLVIHPNLKNKRDVSKHVFKALILMVVIYTWIVFITIYYLGVELVPKSLWPFTLVTESIVVPVISNFRFIFVFLWSIVLVKTVSNYYYYLVYAISTNINVKEKTIAIIIGPIATIIAFSYANEIVRRYIGNVIIDITIVFNVLYITLIFIITYIKEKTNNNKLHKIKN